MPATTDGPIEGRVTIKKTSSNIDDDRITIVIRHGNVDVEASMTKEDFADAICGQARMPAAVRRWPVPGRNRTETP